MSDDTMTPERVVEIAESLNACERDLLTGNITGWGGWITATYPDLISRGLMERRYDAANVTILNTVLGQAVADHLLNPGASND